MSRIPTLIGIGGPFKGEVYYIEPFKSYVVGRSRQSDISVKRTAYFKTQTEAERDADTDAKTISAKHFQITFYNQRSIEIRNLSVNGTLLDGKPIAATKVIEDISIKPHDIRFGLSGRFKLTLAEREEPSDDPLPLS